MSYFMKINNEARKLFNDNVNKYYRHKQNVITAIVVIYVTIVYGSVAINILNVIFKR